MGYVNMILILELIVAVNSFLLGIFCVYRPEKAINMEQEFYRWINWDTKPISMNREVRNTVIMGILLILLTLPIAYYVVLGLRC